MARQRSHECACMLQRAVVGLQMGQAWPRPYLAPHLRRHRSGIGGAVDRYVGVSFMFMTSAPAHVHNTVHSSSKAPSNEEARAWPWTNQSPYHRGERLQYIYLQMYTHITDVMHLWVLSVSSGHSEPPEARSQHVHVVDRTPGQNCCQLPGSSSAHQPRVFFAEGCCLKNAIPHAGSCPAAEALANVTSSLELVLSMVKSASAPGALEVGADADVQHCCPPPELSLL